MGKYPTKLVDAVVDLPYSGPTRTFGVVFRSIEASFASKSSHRTRSRLFLKFCALGVVSVSKGNETKVHLAIRIRLLTRK
jgi:hypothetical protein